MDNFHEFQAIFRAKYFFNDLLDDAEDEIREEQPKRVLENENRTFIPFDAKIFNIRDETLYEYNEFIVNNSFGAFRQKMYYDKHLKKYDPSIVLKNIQKMAKLVRLVDEYVDLKSSFRYTPPEPEPEDCFRKRFRKTKVPDVNFTYFKHQLVHTQKIEPKITTRLDLVDRIKGLIVIQKELDDLLELEDFIGDSDVMGFWIPSRVKFSYDAFKYAKNPKNGIEIVELSSKDISAPLETSAKISKTEKSRNQKKELISATKSYGRYGFSGNRSDYPRKSNSNVSSGYRTFGNSRYKNQDGNNSSFRNDQGSRKNYKGKDYGERRNSSYVGSSRTFSTNRNDSRTSQWASSTKRSNYDTRKTNYDKKKTNYDHRKTNNATGKANNATGRTNYATGRTNYDTKKTNHVVNRISYTERKIHIEKTYEEKTINIGTPRKTNGKPANGDYNGQKPAYSGNYKGMGPRKSCWTNKNYYYKGQKH